LGKRLTALEQIAEECRRREQRDILRTEIERRYAAAGMPLRPDQVEAKVDRALVLAEHVGLLAAGGLTRPQIVQRLAIEHDLDPERVLAVFAELRAERGRPL
jgi:hypothetical protein